MNSKEIQYKTEIFTGVRPTGNLTVANYLGAIDTIIKLQNEGRKTMIFVADLHAMTDNEPSLVQKYIPETVAAYLALGINPKKTIIFKQSDIAGQIMTLTALLARHTTVSELLRVPTLKEKLKGNTKPENANALLFFYPVMMAADILIQRAQIVPVGEDQLVHIEATRELARKFNSKYGEIFPLPKAMQIESLRILSLKGEGKMSKSSPEGAILLDDSAETISKKIKTAETAFEGKMTDNLQSHILVAKGLAKTEEEKKEIDEIIKEHLSGKPVMGKFKQLFIKITQQFLEEFQNKKAEIIKDPAYISKILEEGAKIASQNADETLSLAMKAIYKNR